MYLIKYIFPHASLRFNVHVSLEQNMNRHKVTPKICRLSAGNWSLCHILNWAEKKVLGSESREVITCISHCYPKNVVNSVF